MRRNAKIATWIGSGSLLAASGGYLASQALSAGAAPAVTTTTVDVAAGVTGPAGPSGPPGDTGPTGPAGPAGPPASSVCPAGYVEGDLVINHQGGHVTIRTCIQT